MWESDKGKEGQNNRRERRDCHVRRNTGVRLGGKSTYKKDIVKKKKRTAPKKLSLDKRKEKNKFPFATD